MYRSVLPSSIPVPSDLAAGRRLARALPRHRAVCLAVAAVVSMAAANGAAAQAVDAVQAPPAPDATIEAAEVVTVTATRRREPIRDVPLRVETIDTEALASSGAAS